MFKLHMLLGYAEELKKENCKNKFEILLEEIKRMADEESKELDEMCESLAKESA